jgi:tellurite resistance protein TehA-like permease
MARWIIIAGLVLVVIGLILHFAPGAFRWFGRLPGDIRIEKDNFSIYIPIVSMLVISIVLSVIIYFLRR